ncbi:hypothetical protein [Methylobacterium gossipiicola]|uniref:hypothetical protein n=1 Tax=Methylobacterium gossipiicola TaxID=582675 RepID=UPI001FCD7971|nr:hypothetical protein [Methylobacterium gossipiicola]
MLSLTGLIYGYIAAGRGSFIASQPVMNVYYPASIMLSCAAIVFAGFQVYCALFVRPAPLLRAVVPGILGAWLLALAVPVYQFTVLLGLGQ